MGLCPSFQKLHAHPGHRTCFPTALRWSQQLIHLSTPRLRPSGPIPQPAPASVSIATCGGAAQVTSRQTVSSLKSPAPTCMAHGRGEWAVGGVDRDTQPPSHGDPPKARRQRGEGRAGLPPLPRAAALLEQLVVPLGGRSPRSHLGDTRAGKPSGRGSEVQHRGHQIPKELLGRPPGALSSGVWKTSVIPDARLSHV